MKTARHFLLWVIAVPAMCLLPVRVARGADWPQFRGPGGLSATPEKNLPTEWGGPAKANILWRTPLPKADNGYGSPIVVGGRVYLTIATNHPVAHLILCFDAETGKQIWQVPVEPGPWKLGDLRGGYGASTPACDKKHVIAFFGSAVIACVDLDGKPLWRRELPKTAFDVAIGTSPLLAGDLAIFQLDQNQQKSTLLALEAATGEPRWEQPRPQAIYSHASPILVSAHDKPLLVVSGSSALQGYDPATGNPIWSVQSQGETVSPAIGDGLVYVDTGRGGGGVCIDITGEQPKLLWKAADNVMGEGLSSPLIVEGRIYKMHRDDVLLCRDARTGAVIFSEHLKGISSMASPFVTGDGLIYFASAGKSVVIEPGEKLKIIATSDLGDANPQPSPAVADGRIYLRGEKFLWCVGRINPTTTAPATNPLP